MPSRFDLSTVIRRTPHLASCRLNEEVAILNLDSALYFGVDRVGAQIWEALDQPRSVESLCGVVVDRFDVGPDECRSDLERFLARLQETGLIEVVVQGDVR
jgi:hypothetical protein